MTFEAVFVDLDDTLYPYPPCNEAGKRAAWDRARDLGYDFDEDAFREHYRAARSEVKREIAGTAAAHERFLYFKRLIERYAGRHNSGDAFALGEAYWTAYRDRMSLFDGVEATLDALREAGLSVVIVTNLTTRTQLAKIDDLGIGSVVDRVVTSEEVGTEKPASAMFTVPLARLDLRPSEVVMVGDSVDADVRGANAVGLTTALCNGDADATDLQGPRCPDHRLDSFDELTEVVA